MNSQKSTIKFYHVVALYAALIVAFIAILLYVMSPKTFEVSYQEIATLSGQLEPMDNTPGTSDEDCWIQGFYQEGFIGVCKNLSESLVSFALYSYEGVTITDFFVVQQEERKRVGGDMVGPYYQNFRDQNLNEDFIHENIPGLTIASTPEVIRSGRMSFFNGDRKMWQVGYALSDGKELWVTNYAPCYFCQAFVLVDDHGYMVLGHHEHSLVNENASERAIVAGFTYLVSGNDLLVYQEGSSQISIREVDFSSQLEFINRQGQTCHFEFIGYTNIYHPFGIDETLTSKLGLPEDYLVKAKLIVVRLDQASGFEYVVFGKDVVLAGSEIGRGNYEFEIIVPPTPVQELPELVVHTNSHRVFHSQSGSVLMREPGYSPRAYQYFDSEEICNPRPFNPETTLRPQPPLIFGS